MAPDERCTGCGGTVTGLETVDRPVLPASAELMSSEQFDAATAFVQDPPKQAKFWGGFAGALVFGLLGLIVVCVATKGEPRRGALWGYATRWGFTLATMILSRIF